MATLKEVQEQHDATVEANRRAGVVEYPNSQPVSDKVFEVTEGLKYVPGPNGTHTVLGPGARFHPTEHEIEPFRNKGGRHSLQGKARELTGTEYAGLKASSTTVAGADIGLRALPITGHVLKFALEARLTEADFRGIEPAGPGGNYTKAQVEEIIARRAN